MLRTAASHPSLVAFAVLPAAAVQVLLRVACEAELGQDGSAVDLASLGGALVQLFALLAATIAQVQHRFPLPLCLAAIFGIADAVGQLVTAFLSQGRPQRVDGLIGVPCVLMLMGGLGQLLWSSLGDAALSAKEHKEEQVEMQRCIRRLTKQNSKLEERLLETRGLQGASAACNKGVIHSRFDSVMEEVDDLLDALREGGCLPDKVLEQANRVLKGLKASLLSTDLFRVDLEWDQPLGTAGLAGSDDLLAQESLHQIQELCNPVTVQVSTGARGPSHSDLPITRRPPQGEPPMLPEEALADLPGIVHVATASSCNQLLASEQVKASAVVAEADAPTYRTDSQSLSSKLFESQSGFGSLDNVEGLMGRTHPEAASGEGASASIWSPDGEAVVSSRLGQWNFDAHRFEQYIPGHALLGAGMHFAPPLLRAAGLEDLDTGLLRGFLVDIEQRYRPVPYHNSVHAADVLNSTMYLLAQDEKASHWPLTAVARLAAFVAAIIHDVGHFGRNNRYHVMQHDAVAVLYNDSSPLENMHCAIGFFVLQQPHASFLRRYPGSETPRSGQPAGEATTADILSTSSRSTSSTVDGGARHSSLSDEDFTQFRRCVIEAVLATDMAKHGETMTRFRAAIAYGEREDSAGALAGDRSQAPIALEPPAERAGKVCGFYLKAADVGHTAKMLEVTHEMTVRIHREFFAQGDGERALGLPISPLCDRATTNIARSQVGFLQCLVLPLYEVLHHYIPTVELQRECIDQLEANIAHWAGPTPLVAAEDIEPDIVPSPTPPAKQSCSWQSPEAAKVDPSTFNPRPPVQATNVLGVCAILQALSTGAV